MINLSYSTLRMLHENSHGWVNRELGIPAPDNEWFRRGREAEKLITGHLSGALMFEPFATKLAGLSFPIVAQKQYDERLKFDVAWSEKYHIIGFADGLNHTDSRILECKTPVWGLPKFHKSMQRKIYAFGFPQFKTMTMVSCDAKYDERGKLVIGDMKVWNHEQTDADREDAKRYIQGGIAILEAGVFTGGLNEAGRCVDRWCMWQDACHFR